VLILLRTERRQDTCFWKWELSPGEKEDVILVKAVGIPHVDYFIYFHLFLKWGIADSADIGPYSQGYGLPGGHVQLWELDCKEGWAPKNWCLQTVVLEKTPETPLDSKELKPVNLKRNQPWLLTGRRLMLKLKLQYFGHLMQIANSSLMQWTGRPGMLQSMGLQRVGHDWVTSLSFLSLTVCEMSEIVW